MPEDKVEPLLTFPARPVRPDEQELVAEWLAAAGDAASAFVSQRRCDDPEIYRKIVISTGSTADAPYLIHAPSGEACWVVVRAPQYSSGHRFRTLRAALNSVRRVLPD